MTSRWVSSVARGKSLNEKAKRELECLEQGLVNDVSLRRITRTLIDEFGLPDGAYSKSSVSSCVEDGEYRVSLELLLPASRPIKRGTAVIGGDVRLFIDVFASSPLSLMDLSVCGSPMVPVEKDGEIHYSITLRLLEDQAKQYYVSPDLLV